VSYPNCLSGRALRQQNNDVPAGVKGSALVQAIDQRGRSAANRYADDQPKHDREAKDGDDDIDSVVIER